MNPGDVVFWPKFTFDDGGVSDKLLVIVGCANTGSRLFLKTTSKGLNRRLPSKDGCHSEVFFFGANLGGFKLPTWVLFDPPIIRAPVTATNAGAYKLFQLGRNDFQAVLNCYRRSDDASDYLIGMLPK